MNTTNDKQAQAPRLNNGGIGFGVWRDAMHVFLQRAGAEGIHSKVMLESSWLVMVRSAEEWADDELAGAFALITSGSSMSTSSNSTTMLDDGSSVKNGLDETSVLGIKKLSDEMKAARKLVTATVERSRKVFGIIYTSLPDDLRSQIAHIANGFAYGLWHWLETKFQSTEEDSVAELFSQWSNMRQDDGESFDAYRARVNKLRDLLKQAKEEPSARMYGHVMLDRLQPRYTQAVLALKAGGQMKDASAVSWDTVTAFINAHERSEQRAVEAEVAQSARAMAVGSRAAAGGIGSGGMNGNRSWSQAASDSSSAAAEDTKVRPRTFDNVQCYNCQQYGHYQSHCPEQRKNGNDRYRDGLSGNSDTDSEGFRSGSRSPRRQGRSVERFGKEVYQAQVAIGRKINRFAALDGLKGFEESFEVDSSRVPVKVTTQRANCINAQGSSKRVETVAAASAAVGVKKKVPVLVKKHTLGKGCHWGIDSMASLHLSGDKSLFAGGLKCCKPLLVDVANGERVTVRHCGTVHVSVATEGGQQFRIRFDKVYYHPKFSANLLSSQVLNKQGWKFIGLPDKTFLESPGGKRVILDRSGNVSTMKCNSVIESDVVTVAQPDQSATNTYESDDEDYEDDSALSSDDDEVSQPADTLQGGRRTSLTAGMNEQKEDGAEVKVPSYEIECIVDKRKRRGGLIEFKVCWAGDGDNEAESTWEPASKLEQEVPDMVRQYLARLPRQSPRFKVDASVPTEDAPKVSVVATTPNVVPGPVAQPQESVSVKDDTADEKLDDEPSIATSPAAAPVTVPQPAMAVVKKRSFLRPCAESLVKLRAADARRLKDGMRR
jgi:hypothetical protein